MTLKVAVTLEKLLVKGQKIAICKINDPSQQIVFELVYPRSASMIYDVDVFAYMIENNGRVNKKNIIFYNNPRITDSDIIYNEIYESTQIKKSFEINFNKIHSSIEHICLVGSIYCKNRKTLKEQMCITLQMQAVNKTLRGHLFSSIDKVDITTNQAFIIGDIYKYKDMWKYNAVKQEIDENLIGAMTKVYNTKIY